MSTITTSQKNPYSPFPYQQEPEPLEILRNMSQGGGMSGDGELWSRQGSGVEGRTLPHRGNPLYTLGSPSLKPQESGTGPHVS